MPKHAQGSTDESQQDQVLQEDVQKPKPKVERPHTPKAVAILGVLCQHRRTLAGQVCTGGREDYCDGLLRKVERFIERGEQIRFAFTAFPFKSRSRAKTLTDDADLAEVHSLLHLDSICKGIQKIHGPGAVMQIYSDGYAYKGSFPDHHFDDGQYLRYLDQLRDIIDEHGLSIEVINLEGKYDLKEYAESVESFSARIKRAEKDPTAATVADINALTLYRGQKHFLEFELREAGYKGEGQADSAFRKKVVAPRAKMVAIASVAMSKIIDAADNHCIRLSCHPKSIAGEKVGIWFIDSHSGTGTPWHNALAFVLNENGKCSTTLMRAAEAEKEGHLVKHCPVKGTPLFLVAKPVHDSACAIQTFFKKVKEKKAERAALSALDELDTVLDAELVDEDAASHTL